MSARPEVIVLGGGLAGVTAALDCAEAGMQVTLVEVRRRLGGAAYSFERDGLQLDNGQHVFLRCCAAYRDLLERLGSTRLTRVQPRLEIPVLKPGAPTTMLRRSSLPAPLQLSGALARYPHLTLAQRAGAVRATLALMRLRDRGAGREDTSFGEWLARHGQGPPAVAALWDLIALPTLNLPAAQASLALAAFVFRTGLLSETDAGDIGFHEATLSQTIGEPALRALQAAGVQVQLGWRAERLERVNGELEVRGRRARGPGGEEQWELRGAAVVLALPHARAGTLLEPLLGEGARALRGLGSSPIVNVHVLYDRRVCEHMFAAGVGTPVQYVFDRTRAAGAPEGTQYLAVSLSAAVEEMQMSDERLRERYLPALRALFPRAREARIEMFTASREHAATFRAAPGVEALRPAAVTRVPGLVLAGAWTATGWPATLEGAVISGHAAAARALAELGATDPGANRAAARGAGSANGARVDAGAGSRQGPSGAESTSGALVP